MKKFFKFKKWEELAQIQDPKKLKKAISWEILKGFILVFIFIGLVIGYRAFDSLILGEKHGLVRDDQFDCIYEDYKEAERYFPDKEWVAGVKWKKDPESIIVEVNNIKKMGFPLQKYEGCKVIYIKEDEGTVIPISW